MDDVVFLLNWLLTYYTYVDIRESSMDDYRTTYLPARVSLDAQVTVDIQESSMDDYSTTYLPARVSLDAQSNCGHPGIIHG